MTITVEASVTLLPLQKALDGLFIYCNNWSLKVNTDKTKVIIFSKGKITKYKSFDFGNREIDVVDDYVYLGTKFNYNGLFNKAKAKQVLQAKKAYYSLLSKAKQLDLAADVFLDLVEKLVIPVLLYGSEIWGYESVQHLQVMLNNTMRKFLRVHKSTPTCMIKGELGIKDISEYVDNRILNHWCNIATGEYKISSILYQWVKKLYDQNIFKSKWLDKVKCTLDHTGMSNIFHNISDVNKQWFKNTVKLRLSDIHNQKWSESVFNNSVHLNYRVMIMQKKLQT